MFRANGKMRDTKCNDTLRKTEEKLWTNVVIVIFVGDFFPFPQLTILHFANILQ